MRLGNLLWLVILFIVLRARHSRQHPKMQGSHDDSRLRRLYNYYDPRVDDRQPQVGQYGDSKSWDMMQDETGQAGNCNTMPQQPTMGSTSCTPTLPCPTTCAPQPQQQQPPPPPPPQQQQHPCPQQHPYPMQPEYQQPPPQQPPQPPQPPQYESDDSEARGRELRKLVQHLYVAQARVQLEATEINKAQAVASSAQTQLEDSANHVRTITATLHNAQQEVAAAAIRAQIAQLQLAAHDQLLFAARQDVDALSSQVVGLQAAEGIVQPKLTVDLHALLQKLRQPLQQFDRPTPVPMIITMPPTLDEVTPAPATAREDSDMTAGLHHGSELYPGYDPGYDPGYGYGYGYGYDLDPGTGPNADAGAGADTNSQSHPGSGYDDGELEAAMRRIYMQQ